ncbi:hypothetical protein JTB14_013718 [Gonioctena quinquepunctata]|nr:hypothetical protein JTB14_013718 [Gonioctena quinquepunctata]
MVPITTVKSPVPDALLTLVACSCKKSRTRTVVADESVSCYKLCGSCGEYCSNADPTVSYDAVDDFALTGKAGQIRY